MKAEQLRKSILQMAIQGKLVPQYPNDEPASVLLEKIRVEKQKLIKEGKIKKDKTDSIIFKGDDNRYYEKIGNEEAKCIDDELLFEIPDSWRWVKLQNVTYSIGSKENQILSSEVLTEGRVPVVSQSQKLIDGYTNETHKQIYELPLVMFGDHTKEVKYIDFPFVIGADGTKFHKAILIDVKYLYFLLLYYAVHIPSRGYSRHYSLIKQLFMPLPPLLEQKRIVVELEKFEPLITEYDKLEQQKSKLDNEIYDQVKKSILQYAIQGKLVPQNPNDEPATELLKRIRAEKKAQFGKKYVESYIYKGDDNCYYEKIGNNEPVLIDNLPFEIPDSWRWCRLDSLCNYIHRGKSPVYGTETILPIIAQKCNQWSGIKLEKCLFANISTICKYSEEHFLRVNDIIINSTGTGTVGRTGIINETLFEKNTQFVTDSHITVVRPCSMSSGNYIYLVLISALTQTDLESKCSGSTNQKELATKTICNFFIPLPPYNEQVKICEQVYKILSKLKDEI